MKLPNWIKNAYKSTDVHWSKSQTVIHKMLNELGVFDVRFTNLKDKFALEFLITVTEGKPRAVRIVVPVVYNGDVEEKRQKELNTLHRILVAHLKAKFIAIGRGLTEFEEEFMSHLVITDKFGNSKTMGEALLPQYRDNLESGENKDFRLLGDGNSK
jgi:hypothetical protein